MENDKKFQADGLEYIKKIDAKFGALNKNPNNDSISDIIIKQKQNSLIYSMVLDLARFTADILDNHYTFDGILQQIDLLKKKWIDQQNNDSNLTKLQDEMTKELQRMKKMNVKK